MLTLCTALFGYGFCVLACEIEADGAVDVSVAGELSVVWCYGAFV